MAFVPIRLHGREIGPHKAIRHPSFTQKTVLTNNPWLFVALWLKRKQQNKALFYWEQAQHFLNASVGLPAQSAPLLLYYSYMNAAKALLVSKGIPFTEAHGVSGDRTTRRGRSIDIKNEQVKFHNQGVLAAIVQHFGETETDRTYNLRDLLFNLSFIHRTYCLTYPSQREIFLPLKDCRFIFDSTNQGVFFRAAVDKDFSPSDIRNRLPNGFSVDPDSNELAVKSNVSIAWTKATSASASELSSLSTLHTQLRMDLHYINGSHTLWYLKMSSSNRRGPKRIKRYPMTLILAAMHRLSELCRYKPLELSSYLDGQKNWLLSEFISMSSSQFIDEIAAELTGHQFLIPNVRAPI